MEAFLLKSTACLTLLLGLYYLFLEREKIHTFNRFYLLFSLIFSFIVPFITIEVAGKVFPKPILFSDLIPIEIQNPITNQVTTGTNAINTIETDYTPMLLWGLYALITLFFIVRFGKNIFHLVLKAKKNRTITFKNSTLVLTGDKQLPHTFLKYIFINKDDFDTQNIQEELYTHELTHVKQGHTYDILFIEILKTLFWFNPILSFYKKAIQLNHEFLADETVVESHKNVPFYQKLLIEKASWNSTFYLASNLNFSVTKKRLIMMTKTTSKSRALLKKLVLLPVLAGLVFIFCLQTQTSAAKTPTEVWINGTRVQEKDMDKPISNWQNQTDEASFFAGVRFIIYAKGIQTKDKIVGKDILLDKVYEELTAEDKQRLKIWLRVPKGYVKKSPTSTQLEDYKNGKKFAIWIDGVHVDNSKLNQMKPSDIAYFSGSSVLKNARSKKFPQPFQFWFYTHDYFDKKEMDKAPKKYGLDTFEVFEKIEKKKSQDIKVVPYKGN